MNDTIMITEDQHKEFILKGANEEVVQTIEEILEIIKKGETNRHYAATIMNHSSSRSHTIFRLYVQCMSLQQNTIMTESILNFVDLAGSEKLSIHDAIKKKKRDSSAGPSFFLGSSSQMSTSNALFKDRITESKHINKSLFFLTQVISLRSQGKPDMHIPYRNSPLTKILKSSLGGNSRTVIILNINPCISQIEYTLSTLRFGQNAKKIENQVQTNFIKVENDEVLKDFIKDLEMKITNLENEKIKTKTESKHLFGIIQNLQIQKQELEQKILQKDQSSNNLNENLPFTCQNVFLKNQNFEHQFDDIMLPNVGVLHNCTKEDSVQQQLQNPQQQNNNNSLLVDLLINKEINNLQFVTTEGLKLLQEQLQFLMNAVNTEWIIRQVQQQISPQMILQQSHNKSTNNGSGTEILNYFQKLEIIKNFHLNSITKSSNFFDQQLNDEIFQKASFSSEDYLDLKQFQQSQQRQQQSQQKPQQQISTFSDTLYGQQNSTNLNDIGLVVQNSKCQNYNQTAQTDNKKQDISMTTNSNSADESYQNSFQQSNQKFDNFDNSEIQNESNIQSYSKILKSNQQSQLDAQNFQTDQQQLMLVEPNYQSFQKYFNNQKKQCENLRQNSSNSLHKQPSTSISNQTSSKDVSVLQEINKKQASTQQTPALTTTQKCNKVAGIAPGMFQNYEISQELLENNFIEVNSILATPCDQSLKRKDLTNTAYSESNMSSDAKILQSSQMDFQQPHYEQSNKQSEKQQQQLQQQNVLQQQKIKEQQVLKNIQQQQQQQSNFTRRDSENYVQNLNFYQDFSQQQQQRGTQGFDFKKENKENIINLQVVTPNNNTNNNIKINNNTVTNAQTGQKNFNFSQEISKIRQKNQNSFQSSISSQQQVQQNMLQNSINYNNINDQNHNNSKNNNRSMPKKQQFLQDNTNRSNIQNSTYTKHLELIKSLSNNNNQNNQKN